MTKSDFRMRVILSSVLTAAAIAVVIGFCVIMFDKYSHPSEENTSLARGMVADVYYSMNTKEVMIELSDGESFQLVCPWIASVLYDAIGYDQTQLADLLVGNEISYLRMNKLPWMVAIYFADIVIDNSKLTSEEIVTTHIGIVILGLMMLAIIACLEVEYLKAKYRLYVAAERRQMKKRKRAAKKHQSS